MLRILFLLPMLAVAQDLDGEKLYKQRCGPCHDGPEQPRMPRLKDMRERAADAIFRTITQGSMIAQGLGLKDGERRAIARYASGKDLAINPPRGESRGICQGKPAPFAPAAGDWNGWSPDLTNARYVAQPGFTVADLPKLQLKWAFGVPDTDTMMSQPTVAGGRVFLGSVPGLVFSLDAATGCTHWTFEAAASVRQSVTLGKAGAKWAVYFGDILANFYAVDALTGKLLWKARLDDHPVARATGGPRYYNGRVYVPLSSVEEPAAGAPSYECCTFRGSLSAFDAATGKRLWKSYTIPDPPTPYRKSTAGVQLHGPAGAAVWSSPTLDLKRKLIYVATGNSYTSVDTKYSDAILAFDVDSGSLKWAVQTTPGDNFNSCRGKPGENNCPDKRGPDYDYGTSPVLKTLPGGKDILIAAQKSAVVYGLDPDDKGRILWEQRVGAGSALGGVEWGHAVDDEAVYAAVSDVYVRTKRPGGISALKLATGEKLWSADPPELHCEAGTRGCNSAQSAAVTVIPGAVFSGSIDGHLRAFDTKTGKILWAYDTRRKYETVNGIPGEGGSLDYGGPVFVQGQMFVTSGAAKWAGAAGNVLLVFEVPR